MKGACTCPPRLPYRPKSGACTRPPLWGSDLGRTTLSPASLPRPEPGAMLGQERGLGKDLNLTFPAGPGPAAPGCEAEAKGANPVESACTDPAPRSKGGCLRPGTAGLPGARKPHERRQQGPALTSGGSVYNGAAAGTKPRGPRSARPRGAASGEGGPKPGRGVCPPNWPRTAPRGGWEWEAVREGECGRRKEPREGLTFPAGPGARTVPPGRCEFEGPEATGAEAAVAAAAAASGSAYLPAAILTPLPQPPRPAGRGGGGATDEAPRARSAFT